MDIHGYVDMDMDLVVGGLDIAKSRGLDIHTEPYAQPQADHGCSPTFIHNEHHHASRTSLFLVICLTPPTSIAPYAVLQIVWWGFVVPLKIT
jgi:hypothetical protein